MTMSSIKVTLIDHMGSDLSVVNAARVSFGKEAQPVGWKSYNYEDGSGAHGQTHGEFIAILEARDHKLIRYLAEHKHLSPFGHAFASFHVKAPIFVARQLVKHKFLRWNEISRRYVDDEPELYWPSEIRMKADNVKQGSGGKHPTINHGVGTGYYQELKGEVTSLLDTYEWLIKEGVAPEQARMILPQNTMTEWYWSGSLDAFAAMCKLRCASDTQYESRVVANQISEVMGQLFPVSWASLMDKERSDDE